MELSTDQFRINRNKRRAFHLSHSRKRFGRSIRARRKQDSCGQFGIKLQPLIHEGASIIQTLKNHARFAHSSLRSHKFTVSMTASNYYFYLMHIFQKGRCNLSPPQNMTFSLCLFDHVVRFRHRGFVKLLSWLRIVGLWTIWRSRMSQVFEGARWTSTQVRHFIWESMLDYGRIDSRRN